ncbi:hypothetical protein B0I35DRAFT_114689 [Stachybotrys elegans]|uniref:Uncharacterized protein n=1 Tax=Stachybotrys elegans TaxID=80388 RepID=A0A8K0SG15_9HYPO|nr:hypothetical protein B0I35DRAFT_114689 [Stachybotrys elegans]
MHSFTTILMTTIGFVGLCSAGQVNFYFDLNCQNFAGSVNVGSFQTTGGPAGSHSAMWISRDQASCSNTCGPLIICGDSNCNTRRAAGQWPNPNACEGFSSGVWARNGCGQDMCGNA